MTAATPLARYSAVEGALASGFATADLHHAVGHDRSVDWIDMPPSLRGMAALSPAQWA
ncbi:hypothetical protein X737_36370 [Mesorhizobium sp. L48C026A00]|nr:hypothetical protein X737_36370 [Mesorhizobium sp. L48C026A00]